MLKILLLFTIIVSNIYAAPVIKLNKIKIDLGEAKKGEIKKDNSLIIKNKGDRDLKIKIQSTCECLKIKPEKIVIKPGENKSVEVIYDTHLDTGYKIFYLITNDPRFPTIPIKVIIKVYGRNIQKVTHKEKKEKVTRGGEIKFLYFLSPTCRECIELKEKFFPKIEHKFNVNLNVIEYDINKPENFNLLLKYKEYFKEESAAVPVIIYGTNYIAGIKEIKGKLPKLIKRGESQRIPEIRKKIKKLPSISIIPVITAGLLDGINPCAFATIIFLISYLSYLKKSRRVILLTGIFYTGGVFITYFLIGLGFFEGIRSLPFFHKISRFVNFAIAGLCFFMGYLSFKDFLLALKGKFSEMKLQLSKEMKQKIHKTIREKTRAAGIIISAFIMGVMVSFFELACTGQIYLPTVIYLTKTSPLKGILFLIIYNLMFILPLIMIFYFYYRGTTSEKIKNFFEKRVALVKALTTVLFIAIGAILIYVNY